VAAYQAIGAASLADSYVNLANPGTYDAAPGVAPSWAAASGWTFNGTTQYLTTSYTPTATNHTVAVRYSNYTRAATYPRLLGAAKTGNQDPRTLIASDTTQSAWANGGSVKFLATPLGTSGVAVVAAANAYLDGASIGTLTTSGTALTCGLYIGAQNNGGVVGNYGSSTIQAIAIYNATLTADQVSALTTAMNALTG